jgi:hypothetical protein
VAPTPLGDGTYVGEIRAFAAEQCPVSVVAGSLPKPGWVECDGTTYTVANHRALFDVIGTRFGVDDAGRFSVPDLRGAFIRGWNHGKKEGEGTTGAVFDPQAGGRSVPSGGPQYPPGKFDHVGTYQGDAVGPHSGISEVVKIGEPDASGNIYDASPSKQVAQAFSGKQESSGPESRPRNVYLIYCIRDPAAGKPQ